MWNEKLFEFVEEFAKEKESEYETIAKQTSKDIKYFEEHIKRVKINPIFNFKLVPFLDCDTGSFYVCNKLTKEPYFCNQADNLMLIMMLIDVTKAILSPEYLGNGDDEKKLWKLLEWSEIFEHYTKEDLFDSLDMFVWSSGRLQEILQNLRDLIDSLPATLQERYKRSESK
jgi:hypothetical protein